MELLITLLAGSSVLAGAGIVRIFGERRKEAVEHVSMAMALAALLALLIFDLIPELAEHAEKSGWVLDILMVPAGFFLLVILDHFVPEHEDTEENHDRGNALHIGIIASLGIIVHNLVEGMTVYSVLFADLRSGIILALGIALHNLPMGMMLYASVRGESRRKKGMVLGAVTVSTWGGGIIMQAVSGHLSETLTGVLVSAAAGMILYIVFAELLPHVFRTKGWKLNLAGALMGFGLVYLSQLIGG